MIRFANRIKKPFEYTNAADTSKPGYLQRKFQQVKKKQLEDAANKQELPNIVFQNFTKGSKRGP